MSGRVVNSSPAGREGEEMSVTSPCNSGNHSTSGETGGVETEEEEEDAGETTMVLTCEGNITDPNLSTKLECLMHRLQHLTQAERAPKVHVVEPWNSVRVTFSIPREAARRLHLLAQAGEPALRSLGILSIQVQGDQVVSLRLAGNSSNSEGSEIILRTTDGPVSGNVMERISGLLGSSGNQSGHAPPHHHHPHHHHQQTMQYRAAHPQTASFPYQQATAAGAGGLQAHGAVAVRNSGGVLHHRPAYVANHQAPPPPPYPSNEPHLNLPHGAQAAAPSSFVVHNAADPSSAAQPVANYRLTAVSGAPAMLGTAVATAGGRHVIVRPPPPTQQILHHHPQSQSQQQQQQQQQQIAAASASGPTPVAVVSTMGNVVKNSPLLVGLLQQPDQPPKPAGGEVGLASGHLTSLASNHFTTTHAAPTSSQVHHRQMVNSSVNHYSSSTRSKDGLTTHQQVFSGGSVITNARVPVPGGLQQHPQATGKPPPVSSMGSLGQHANTTVTGGIQPVSAAVSSMSRAPKLSNAMPHLTAAAAAANANVSSSMQQVNILPQRANVQNSGVVSNNGSVLSGAVAAASPSPAISPTPSLPSPHPSSTPGVTQATVSGMTFASNHVTALTPPLTPSNQQIFSSGSASTSSSGASTLADSLPSTTSTVSSSSTTCNTSIDVKGSKSPSPKMLGSKESQYLINPNTGLLEPRHNTDSSDSESDQRSSSPVQKNCAQPVQALPISSSSFLTDQSPSSEVLSSNKLESLPSSDRAEDKSQETVGLHENSDDSNKSGIAAEASKFSLEHGSKEENSSNSSWEDNRIVTTPGSGELRLKLKLGNKHLPQKVLKPNLAKKLDKKDSLTNLSSSVNQSGNEQRVPKIHIKFGSHTSVIVKAEEKEKTRKLLESREDKKRRGSKKKSRLGDCESDRADSLKIKSGCMSDSSLKVNDAKRIKLELESDEPASVRTKEGVDTRTKGPRTFEDRYASKVDNVKSKFDAKLRTRSKIKTPMRKLGGINNIGEIASHKILETLPPSITKVAAMHTQQPHRNPTSSSSNFFNSTDQSTSSSLSDLGSTLNDTASSSSVGKSSPLMNGDMSHSERSAAVSRALQSNTFSELTSARKLTIKRKTGASEALRTSTSLSLLKKETSQADSKRKIGLSCIPTYLNSSVLINKVPSSSSGSVSNTTSSTSYARLHDTDRGGRPSPSPRTTKGGDLLKTALCANFPSLNANSDITIQSVRKKDVITGRPNTGSAADETQILRSVSATQKSSSFSSLPDGINKSGRVTCIDVTDRRAVEEAVKSSRNSSGSTNDNQPKLSDKLDRWSSANLATSSANSTPPSSLVSTNLAVRLQPDSTNFFSSSVSVESKEESSKSSSSYQPSTDPDSGVHKSHVESSNLVVNTSNCDTSVKRNLRESGGGGGDDLCSVSVSAAMNNSSSVAHNESNSEANTISAKGASETGKDDIVAANSAATSIQTSVAASTAACSKPSDVESPEGTPKGEHGTGGQGGEDSGIESMDALSEKSPNQSDQSPHRRDDKDCEAYPNDASKTVSSGGKQPPVPSLPVSAATPVSSDAVGSDCSTSLTTSASLETSSSTTPANPLPSTDTTETVTSDVSSQLCSINDISTSSAPSSTEVKSTNDEASADVSSVTKNSSELENFRLLPSTTKTIETNESKSSVEEGKEMDLEKDTASNNVESDAVTADDLSKPVSSAITATKDAQTPVAVSKDASESLTSTVQEVTNAAKPPIPVEAARPDAALNKPTKQITGMNSSGLECDNTTDPGRGFVSAAVPVASSISKAVSTVAPEVSTATITTAAGSPAMILLACCSASSPSITSISSAGAPKVVTIKSSSFNSSTNSSITPPVGKAFRLVSLPENMAVSPSASPVKGQLVTFKQLVPAGGAIQGKGGVQLAAVSATKSEDGPPSLLKAQLLAPPSNSHHAYPFGVHTATLTTNGEQDNLDFVGFSSTSISKTQTQPAKISQIITPEKDEEKGGITSPTQDEPKPLRVQPPLYTYGGNKDRKKDFDNETEEKYSTTSDKESADSAVKLEANSKDIKPKVEELSGSQKGKSMRDFDVLTIEIPTNNQELIDDKRLTRATRHSARIASPKINSCETSPKTSDRRSPGFSLTSNVGSSGHVTQQLLHLQPLHIASSNVTSNSFTTTNSLSMSSLANSSVSISGRVVANSGSITVTSISGAAPRGNTSGLPATRGSNKRRRYESEDGASPTCPPAKQSRRTRMSASDPPHKIHNTRPTDPNLRYAGDDSSSSDDEAGGGAAGGGVGRVGGASGVVVVGVASCIAEDAAAAAAAASSTASAIGAVNAEINSGTTSISGTAATTPTITSAATAITCDGNSTATSTTPAAAPPTDPITPSPSPQARKRSLPSHDEEEEPRPNSRSRSSNTRGSRNVAGSNSASVSNHNSAGAGAGVAATLTRSAAAASATSSNASTVVPSRTSVTPTRTSNLPPARSSASPSPSTSSTSRTSSPASSRISPAASTSNGTAVNNVASEAGRPATPTRRCVPATRASSQGLTETDNPDESTTDDAADQTKNGASGSVVTQDGAEDSKAAVITRGAAHQGAKAPTAAGSLTSAPASSNKANSNNNNNTTNNNNNSKADEADTVTDNRRKTRSAAAAPDEGHSKRRRVSKDK